MIAPNLPNEAVTLRIVSRRVALGRSSRRLHYRVANGSTTDALEGSAWDMLKERLKEEGQNESEAAQTVANMRQTLEKRMGETNLDGLDQMAKVVGSFLSGAEPPCDVSGGGGVNPM